MSPRLRIEDVQAGLATHLGTDVSQIHGQLRLTEDLGIDSLGMHALLIDIEEAGGIIPSKESLESVSTVFELYVAASGTNVS